MSARSFRDARKMLGFSVRKAAAVLGVAPSTIFRWESGHIVPIDGPALVAMQLLALLHEHGIPLPPSIVDVKPAK